MDTQAKVTLTALNPDLVTPNERVIILTPESSYFPIGRASKSLSKGLQGAVDNAWFDSPVMSRDHAEISMDFENNAITIKDIGSMHGTRLNNSPLDAKSPTPLEDGDIVVFGAEVKRGPETFPACSFRISCEILPYKPANTFAFPDSSEIDEEEDYELSDDDMAGRHNNVSSEDGPSIVSSTRKLVDVYLTRDDSPATQSRNVVNLTGETPAEGRILGMTDGHPSDINNNNNNNNSDPVSIGIYASGPPIGIESEDDDGDFSTDSESDSDPESLDAATPLGFGLNNMVDTDEEEEEDDAESLFETSQARQPEEARPLDNLVQYATDTIDNSKILLFDDNVDLDTSEGESDDQSDLRLSEAGAEGMKALFDSNLLPREADDAFGFESPRDDEYDETSIKPTSKHISFETLMDPNSAHSTNITAANATAHHFLESTLNRAPQIVRQPSPSDAAMVKTAITPQQGSAHVGVCMIGEVGNSSVQKLGEKSGKVAYFRAREANKANFQRMENKEAEESSQPIPASTASHFSTAPVVCMLEGQQSDDAYPNKMATSPAFPKSTSNDLIMPTREQCAFLDSADQHMFPMREASPLPDMTSAVVYNSSKETMAAAAAANTRSGIKIKDIIENNSSPQIINSNKRKADEISKASAAELRTWAWNPASQAPLISSSRPASFKEEVNVSTQDEQDVALIATPSEARPTKKQRVLEKVGYIALGGVTAVAGLFGILVMTAPEF